MKATQCTVEGCERGAHGQGFCNTHYSRWYQRGSTEPPRQATPPERLAANLVRMSNGCLEWTSGVDDRGYGQISVDGKHAKTHRLAWMLANGPIPEGLFVLHRCDNPPCAQTEATEGYPDGHLFLGTHSVNMADMITKGRGNNQKKTHCPQGHEYTETNTYVLPSRPRARYCRTCINIRHLARYYSKRPHPTRVRVRVQVPPRPGP